MFEAQKVPLLSHVSTLAGRRMTKTFDPLAVQPFVFMSFKISLASWNSVRHALNPRGSQPFAGKRCVSSNVPPKVSLYAMGPGPPSPVGPCEYSVATE